MGKGSKKKTVWRQFSFGDFDNDSYSKGDEEDSESSKATNSESRYYNSNYYEYRQKYYRRSGSYSSNKNSNDSNVVLKNYNRSSTNGKCEKENFSTIMTDEGEYTRISTPRSEVLFKKGYLSRRKINDTASSSCSASVSVISGDEPSINHDNNGFTSPPTYPNDGYNQDISLMYSSGFYGSNGVFYVNPYLINNFDQYNTPSMMMSIESPQSIETQSNDLPFPPSSASTLTSSASNDFKRHNSINSDEASASSLSETCSTNNVTPPPSPAFDSMPPDNIVDQPTYDKCNNNFTNDTHEQPNDNDHEPISSENEQNAENVSQVYPDMNSSFIQPIIFAPPPIPIMTPYNRSGGNYWRKKYNQHYWNHHQQNFVQQPISFVMPEQNAQMNGEQNETKENGENDAPVSNEFPSEEQCDKILQNTNLNLNVCEFVPRRQQMIFIPLPIPPNAYPIECINASSSISSSIPSSTSIEQHQPLQKPPKPIPPIESSLNVNVPEFHPRDYITKNPIHESHQTTFEQNDLIKTNDNDNVNNDVDRNETKLSRTENDNNISEKTEVTMTKNQFDKNHSQGININNHNNNKREHEKNKNFKLKKLNNDNNWRRQHQSDHHRQQQQQQQFSQVNSKADLVNKYSKKSNNNINNNDKNRNDFTKKRNNSVTTNVRQKMDTKKLNENNTNDVDSSSITYAQMLSTNSIKNVNVNDKIIDNIETAICINAEPTKFIQHENIPTVKKFNRKTKFIQKNLKKSLPNDSSLNEIDIGWRTVYSKGRKKPMPVNENAFETDEMNVTNVSIVSTEEIEKIMEQITIISSTEDIDDVEDVEQEKQKEKQLPINNKNIEKITEITETIEIEENGKKSKKCKKRKNNAQTKIIKSTPPIQNKCFEIIEPIFDEFSINDISIDPNIFATPNSINNPIDTYSQCNNTNNLRNDARLKEDEEIVIRVLQQLNKNDEQTKCNDDCQQYNNTVIDKKIGDKLNNSFDNNNCSNLKSSIRRYSINAKPYQNVYSSNHFLGHFFGDKDDKRKHPDDELTSSSSGCNHFNEVKINTNLNETTIIMAQMLNDTNNSNDENGKNENWMNDEIVLEQNQNEFIRCTKREKLESIDSGMCMDSIHDQTNSIQYQMDNSRKLLIVDTDMLENQKKNQQIFPITKAVTLWLDQMKEHEKDNILRFPSIELFGSTFEELLSTTTNNSSSYETNDNDSYSTDDSSSIHTEKQNFHLQLSMNNRNHSFDMTESTTDSEDDDEFDSIQFNDINGLHRHHHHRHLNDNNSILKNAIKQYQETIRLKSKLNERTKLPNSITINENKASKKNCTIM